MLETQRWILRQEFYHVLLYYKVILKCQLSSHSTQLYDYISAWTENVSPHHSKKKQAFSLSWGKSSWSRHNSMQSFVYRLVYIVPKYHNYQP